ncbi:MAG: hypothetical protein DMF60_06050 [Acidobacteria bacterium]|nr:MAG: hypothetical protein DMF60_06050 [Acidobacteriota bacterium]
MIKRIYQMEDLAESAEMLKHGPPWWLHAILFGLILGLLAAVSIISGMAQQRIKSQTSSQKTNVSAKRCVYHSQLQHKSLS